MLGNPEGKKHFENLIVDGNIYHIKTVTKGTGWEVLDWTFFEYGRNQSRALSNTLMSILFRQKMENFFIERLFASQDGLLHRLIYSVLVQ